MKKFNFKLCSILLIIIIVAIIYFFNYREGARGKREPVYRCSNSNNRDDCVNHNCQWTGQIGGKQFCAPL